jgi:hypothetical protein
MLRYFGPYLSYLYVARLMIICCKGILGLSEQYLWEVCVATVSMVMVLKDFGPCGIIFMNVFIISISYFPVIFDG